MVKKGKPKAKKPKNAKTRSPATTRSTAGPGFTFEDQVAAWLLTQMLSGEALPGIGPGGTQLQSQVSALAWHIDDLLVTAVQQPKSRRIALSCKSNQQVSSAGLPADFVLRAWQQWEEAKSGPMDLLSDHLALVTRGRHAKFDEAWSDIRNWCSGGNAALAIARIRQTKKHSTVFDSIKTPKGRVKKAEDEETVELIRHLSVIPLDFQLDNSTSLKESIKRCRSLLVSGSQKEAEDLWGDLVADATTARVGHGTITLTEVWLKLRTKFSLKHHPDFEASWKALTALTNDYKTSIETMLPTGYSIERKEKAAELVELLHSQTVTVVYGQSGSGKSALVKRTLDRKFAGWTQVWLGPEQIEAATSEVDRAKLPLSHPLIDVLRVSVTGQNVLVIDAAERLNANCLPRIKQLIEKLVPIGFGAEGSSWRVVIVSQTEGWRDRAQSLVSQRIPPAIGVEGIAPAEIKAALRASNGLQWLASHDETVNILSNLRTLGWVIQAEVAFQSEGGTLTSLAAIADRIWEYWTGGKTAPQNLLMRLAEREAGFERSFAVSELDPADATIIQDGPKQLPLRKNKRNRLEFQHDLAADWSRFQRLKEIADDLEQWAAFATNPLWSGAIRMLGQLLLREVEGASTRWDVALSVLGGRKTTLAADMLLDALCLDSQAGAFLEERADLLLANNGIWLNRLLLRFLHIATVPSTPPVVRDIDRSLALYLDAHYRTPVYGLWPAIGSFLYKHIEKVANLISPPVAKVCETWLTTTPTEIRAGVPMPYRKELAAVALATARALQVEQGKGTICFGDWLQSIYTAALAGAPDLPDEVATWALEIAVRRPESHEVTRKISDAHAQMAADRAERLKTDPVFRMQQEERAQRLSSASMFLPTYRELPPWPLGPKGRVEKDFRKCCLHSMALDPMMRTRPEVAAEILLALLIEDEPKEEYSPSRLREYLGLEYDGGDSYPTAFWKSRFFSFLQIAPDIALRTLIQLGEFCTARWVQERERQGEEKPPQTTILMRDGKEKTFFGNLKVFDWTQENSHFAGQLHSALNALERWLTLQLDQGADLEPALERILHESSSMAYLGLLVNVAKYRPSLLSGTLMPLLSSQDLYWLDLDRVRYSNWRFDAMTWIRSGEKIFEFAKEWTLAPYRQQTLRQVVGSLIPKEKVLASVVRSVVEKWEKPADRKAAIEFGMLCAELDPANYRSRVNRETGIGEVAFDYPHELKAEIDEYNQSTASQRRSVLIAPQCDRILQVASKLSDVDAQKLSDFLDRAISEPSDEDKENERNKVALAATLASCATDWLRSKPDIYGRVTSIIKEAVRTVGDSSEGFRQRGIANMSDQLKFAAHGMMHLWLSTPEQAEEWEPYVLRLMTSGDDWAVAVLGTLAYRHRTKLGPRWWRLLQLGTLWSALAMMTPDYGDVPSAEMHWQRWLRWFRVRKIAGTHSDSSSVDLVGVWRRFDRLQRARWRRAYAAGDKPWARNPNERSSPGLDTGFLDSLFGWLLAEDSTAQNEALEEQRKLVLQLWSYEAEYCAEHRKEDGEYALAYQFGYNVISKMASLAAIVPAENAPEIWRQVLSLGPDAHSIVDHFIAVWFLQLNQGCEAKAFCARWREMLEFALGAKWTEAGRWYYGEQMLRRLLGFGSELMLRKVPDLEAVILSMCEIYKAWADAHLAREEENIAAFANFLASDAGAPLRIDGIQWIAGALRDEASTRRWRRGGAEDSLVTLLDTTLTKDAAQLSKNRQAREAVVSLAAFLATRHVDAALTLQERIKLLRS
ncbi:hypothetical protein [Candidatus Binatus sp.]|uniref:hypothetical protein n=1 Tax=Candidatus Binatus sp. TaxID=2811406 RepID=UPI003BCB9785